MIGPGIAKIKTLTLNSLQAEKISNYFFGRPSSIFLTLPLSYYFVVVYGTPGTNFPLTPTIP